MTVLHRPPSSALPRGRTAPPLFPAVRAVVHDRAWAAWGATGVVGVVVAGLLIDSGAGGVDEVDLDLVQHASRAHVPVLDQAALLVDRLLGPQLGAALVLLLAVAVWVVTRRATAALTALGVAVGPWAAAELVKLVVQRDRPAPGLLADPLIVEPHSFSFPSGHTALATGLALALVLLAWGCRRALVVIAVCAASVAVVGLSRVWVGVHWPSDTVASAVLGCSVVALALPPWLRLLDRIEQRSGAGHPVRPSAPNFSTTTDPGRTR
ncbi:MULTISPECIES: phosphatase PAP2 family protein [unclassified Frigoribacterium]|uniref:phosphatase PAP2 family protein n=1 Tax=unclassified Frigoribacterium TaxID=2627005 RepID=UPI000F477136|nr:MULTISPECIES: phosphatase PAP2 family protein [unclassified Frigoribacterium]ROP78665.1 undecaprenyl-diphosphatase [Frigoribacterium sp. PhB107]TDT66458.1 undecaprenyl-diphosphatase [Frigoribacterium sp. PhB116]